VIFFLILVFSLFVSCAEKKMSLKEAKQVTVSMSETPFVPPPRRVDDILTIIDQSNELDFQHIAIKRAKLAAPPPDTDHAWRLAKFYYSKPSRVSIANLKVHISVIKANHFRLLFLQVTPTYRKCA
jgi:hypothetical protein